MLSKIVKFSFKENLDVLLVLLVIDKSAFYLIRRLVSRCEEPSFTTKHTVVNESAQFFAKIFAIGLKENMEANHKQTK